MAAKPTILILTTYTGGGHLNLAQALKGMLEAHYDVAIINPQSALVEHYYALVSRHCTSFLSWQYRWTDNALASLWLQRIITLFGGGGMRSVIERVQPQLIITTHAMLAYATAYVNKRNRHVPLVFQLTDLGRVHKTWFTVAASLAGAEADAYLAPTQEIFAQALTEGIDRKRLYLTGRPVRGQFWEAPHNTRGETLDALGLDPAVFTIFLQGGAKGAADVDRTIEGLLRMDVPVQIILAVGNNRKMAARYAYHKRIRPLPFTESIAPSMVAADVIAGKAGASFLSEAFVLEKPVVVTAFIPGQETPNLAFVERHNLGWVCLETAAQRELFSRIASDPELIAEKVTSIKAYKRWNRQANLGICEVIDGLLICQSV